MSKRRRENEGRENEEDHVHIEGNLLYLKVQWYKRKSRWDRRG